MKPGALTQAARSAASRQDGAGARTADRPRTPRTVREAPGDRRASRPARPPRRVSGPAKGKEYAAGPQSAGRSTRARTPPYGPDDERARTTGATSAARSFLPARMPRGVFASGSAAVAAAVALPLRRPFIDREPAPRRAPKPVPAPRPAKSAKPATGILQRVGAFVVSLPDHCAAGPRRTRPGVDSAARRAAGRDRRGPGRDPEAGGEHGSLARADHDADQPERVARDSVASLSDDQRIERLATNMGMVLPPPGAVGYLTANPGGDVSERSGTSTRRMPRRSWRSRPPTARS